MFNKLLDIEKRIQQISASLSAMEFERTVLIAELENLKNSLVAEKLAIRQNKQEFILPYTQATEENIKLFASLFKGREDVLPKRWDNQKNQ